MSTRQERLRRRRRYEIRRRIMLVAGALAVVLLLALLITGIRSCLSGEKEESIQETFLTGTTLNGLSLSGMTLEEAEETLTRAEESYSLTLSFGQSLEDEVVLTATELGLSRDGDFDLETLLTEQKESGQTEFTLSLYEISEKSVNEYLLATLGIQMKSEEEGVIVGMQSEEVVSDSGEEQTIETHSHDAANATIVYNEETGLFEAQAGEASYELPLQETMQLLQEAVDSFAQELSLEGVLTAPEGAIMIGDEELQTALLQMNERLTLTLSYTMNDGETEEIGTEELSQWMYFDEEEKALAYDTDLILTYLAEVESRHETATSTQQFRTTGGSYITISVAAEQYVLDTASMAEDIVSCLENQISGTRSAPYKENTSSTVNGGTYVEVDLTNQCVYLYYNGLLILSTPCVTGDVNNDCATPTGVYKLKNKMRNVTLVGADYATPVEYWMPFNGGIGLHDAWWRVEFGGTIYYYNGSHGCVNLPTSAAATIYEYISIGDYIIVYGGVTWVEPLETEEETEESEEESEEEEETTTETQTTAATTAATTIAATTAETTTEATVATTEAATQSTEEETARSEEETEAEEEITDAAEETAASSEEDQSSEETSSTEEASASEDE